MNPADVGKTALVAALAVYCFRDPAGEKRVVIQPEIAVADVQRFGVNIGFRTSWGAEQLMSNVLMNPGFEGIIDRCLVDAKPVDDHRFVDRSRWLGRQDRFWTGATFQIRTGPSAGYTGRIADSKKNGSLGLPEFTAAEPLPLFSPGDRIALTRISDAGLPTQWWIPTDSTGRVSISSETRPRSRGVRSLRLSPQTDRGAETHSYLDAIGHRAGALLPISGKWRLSFWSCARGGSSLAVTFGRAGGATWIRHAVARAPQWNHTVIEFEAADEGSGVLDLCFRATGTGEVLLDDVELKRFAEEDQAFRREVEETLSSLRPGYLRDWQGQLGDTLDNRVAAPEARRAWRYRPGGNEATDFGYSLPEFLDLCRRVHANPWIVAPTTFSDSEWIELGRFLLEWAAGGRFSEIVIEFGNENWNSIFSAAGIADTQKHAEAADRAFSKLREGAGQLPLTFVVNAQYVNPGAAMQLARHTRNAGLIAVAPYFLRRLDAGESSGRALEDLFAGDGGTLDGLSEGIRKIGREVGVYEINLHTTEGNASESERNPIVAGAAAASALAERLLKGLGLGIRRQCVYVLSGFDTKLSARSGYVRLWGITRDLGPTKRLRPTGLALALLNLATEGDLHRCRSPYTDLTVAPFRSARGWSVAIASAARDYKELRLEFPSDRGVALPTRCLMLKAATPVSTNEESEQVAIAEGPVRAEGRLIRLRMPPYGLAVLLPEAAHHG